MSTEELSGLVRDAQPTAEGQGPGRGFWTTSPAVRVYLTVVALAALGLPIALRDLHPSSSFLADAATAGVLVLLSVLNIEISRRLSGGLALTHQPHKALSAWPFAAALVLPLPWLLVVVPLTYAHARWRGLRVPLWKWTGSAMFVVLAGVAAATARFALMGETTNWMLGAGGRGIVAMLLAAAAFLATETLLFAGSALLGPAEDEAWLRRTLRGVSFYATELGVLLMGGLVSAVWTGGAWFILFFLPIYGFAQRAALHEPLRERAEAAAQLAVRNHELELANQFKIDLMGVLAHEVGNPLASILMNAEMGAESLDASDTADVRRVLAVVERNTLHIRDVLHDLLAMVSSGRGALTAHPEATRLRPHLLAVADSQPSGSRPAIVCAPELTAMVQTGQLDQMLANLVVNARKYAGGATTIAARPVPGGLIEISVLDAGPGVPDAFREHLFDRFSREAETARQVMGSGLGLFITRELARANGGDLIHRPARPHGSEFVITLPQAPPGTTADN